MAGNEPSPGGILSSLRRFCDSVLGLLQNRIELFAIELEEQKLRLVRLIVLAAVVVFLGNTALLVVTAAVVVLAGSAARVPVLIVLSLLYIVGAVIAFFALRKEIRDTPPPFEGTIAELKKDRIWLKPRQ